MSTPELGPVAEWLVDLLATGTSRPVAVLDIPPSAALPYVVLSGVPAGGARPDGTGHAWSVRPTWQVSAVAETVLAASDLADAVLTTLDAATWPQRITDGPVVVAWDLVLAGQPMRRPGDPRSLPFVPHTIALEVTP